MTDPIHVIVNLLEHLWIAACAVAGWFFKENKKELAMLNAKIEKQKESVAHLKVHIAENYTSKDDTAKVMQEILYVRKGVDDIKNILIKRND